MSAMMAYPQAALFGTETRRLHSSIVGRDYQIYVWWPPNYSEDTKKHPVLYVLDGDGWFFPAGVLTLTMCWGREVPDPIVVGIGYGLKSYNDYDRRNEEFTPTAIPEVPGSGGAAKFLGFLQDELFPFVDANYRTDPADRAIVGYSLGGLFALYALLSKPELFQRYIVGSPSVDWDNRFMFQYEKAFAAAYGALPVRLFISVGSLETDSNYAGCVTDFCAALESRNYGGLQLTPRVFEGETHWSGWPRAFVAGVKAVYA